MCHTMERYLSLLQRNIAPAIIGLTMVHCGKNRFPIIINFLLAKIRKANILYPIEAN